MSRLIVLYLFLCFFVSVAEAANIGYPSSLLGDNDYRTVGSSQSPEQFEQSVSLAYLYPNSVIIFSRGYGASWELSAVMDFAADSGGLTAIRQNDLIYLPNGACGGLVAPEEGAISANGNHLIISSADTHTLYYIPDCGWYNRSPKEGDIIAFDDEYICEAAADSYIVKDIIGVPVYRGIATDQPVAAYSYSGKCYYLGREGTLTQVDPKYGEASTLFETTFKSTSVQATDTGLVAINIKSESYMSIRFEPNNAIYVDYNPRPAGDCKLAIGSSKPFCESEYPELYASAASADKLAVTVDGIYMLEDDRLTAYGAAQDWVKSFVPSATIPYVCADSASAAIYYLDLNGAIWHVDLSNEEEKIATAIPESCDKPVNFKDGAFFSANGKRLYQYAKLILQEGGRSLYKRDQGDVVYYIVVQE